MNAGFSVAERKPQAPIFAPARPAVQRKCACGGQCSACRGKHNHGAQISHNFADIKVHADSPARVAGSAFPARLLETENGDTSCDVSKGVPDITLNKPSVCHKDCTERHEAVHKKDISSCCSKAHNAWTNAKDNKKDAVQEKMNDWVEANRYWLECRAYAESVKCATEWITANCGSKRADTEEAAPAQPAGQQGMGDFPTNDLWVGGDQDSAPPSALAEEKSGDGKSDPDKPVADEPKPIDPARCCPNVVDYRFHAKARGEAYCKGAKKNLTPCPF
jgi:hypothetical protein